MTENMPERGLGTDGSGVWKQVCPGKSLDHCMDGTLDKVSKYCFFSSSFCIEVAFHVQIILTSSWMSITELRTWLAIETPKYILRLGNLISSIISISDQPSVPAV